MNGMTALAYRNTLCYFRDRSSVLFSLMGVLVVVMIYLLFLRNMLIDSYPDMEGMGGLVDAWVLSGILGIVSVTTTAGSLQTMVEDRVNGRMRDIMVTSLSPVQIAGGYILSTFLVGLIMSMITFVIALAYLGITGCPMSVGSIMLSLILLIPSSLSGAIIIYAITSLIRSTGAFSGFFVVISVMMGFLAGIYMPVGAMPDMMQVVGALIPASHMASLFRQTLASESLNNVFDGVPGDVMDGFREDMGFDLSLGGFEFSPEMSLAYVLGVTLLFFIIAVMGIRRNR